MKNNLFLYPILSLLFVFCSFQNSRAQTISNSVANTVFVMCDEYGSPIKSDGIAFFLVLHSNKTVNLLMGEDVSSAIETGSLNNGKWYASGSTITWTWNDSGKSARATYNSTTGNMVANNGSIFKNLGKF